MRSGKDKCRHLSAESRRRKQKADAESRKQTQQMGGAAAMTKEEQAVRLVKCLLAFEMKSERPVR